MLFSKSKNESDPEDRTLFDMRKIGKRISELRRSKDITQTALADMMGISFQAVSNWERGESMPDISKLGDLSRIFGVSIDEILCNPRAAKIVEEISAGEKPDDMTAEELAETAPIMTPAQAQENIEENLDKITLAQLAELAPFVSSESLAVIAHKCVDNGCSIAEIAAVAPFMDEDDLGRLALEKLGSGCTLSDLPAIAPFMDKDDLSKIAEKVCKNGCSAKELVAVAPFMDEEAVGKIAFEMSDSKWTVADFALLYPFMDEDNIEKILSEKLGKRYSFLDFAGLFDGDEVHKIINNVKNSMKQEEKLNMIHLTAADLHFLGDNEKERRRDLCLHGSVFLSIDGTVLCDGGEWCVSASVLRFMRSVFVDHISASGEQMIPCCCHFMIPSGDGKTVDIVGCSNGIDFDVIHESGGITVKTADGEKFFVNCSEYRRAVTGFAGQIEQFISNSPSRIFDDDWDRAAVSVFRNEWTALRQRLSPSDLPFPGIFL